MLFKGSLTILLCLLSTATSYQTELSVIGKWARKVRKVGVEEWLMSTVMAMYEGAETVVRTPDSDSRAFSVKMGLHQGSVLSPLLFVTIMEVINKELW